MIPTSAYKYTAKKLYAYTDGDDLMFVSMGRETVYNCFTGNQPPDCCSNMFNEAIKIY